MIRHGSAPFLECSTRGDRRLSAFVARVDGKPIEEIYQSAKVLEDGRTGLTWREAKGKRAMNAKECAELYSRLWDRYIRENPLLLLWLRKWPGLSDRFGQEGRVCQVTELWRIRGDYESFPDVLNRTPCCANERRNLNGGCESCGDPCL